MLTALLLALAFAAAATEVAFRWSWRVPPPFAAVAQPGMFVPTGADEPALQAGFRGCSRVGDAVAPVAIGALGLRGEVPARRDGQRRVLMVGDGAVFGGGVEAAHALPARLEAALHAASVDVVVGNGGMPAVGVTHAVARLARLDAPFQADAFVIAAGLGDDVFDELAPSRTVFGGRLLAEPWAEAVRVSWRARLAVRSRAALWLELQLGGDRGPPWLAGGVAAVARRLGVPGDGAPDGVWCDALDARTVWVAGTEPPIPRVLAALDRSLQRARTAAGSRPVWFVLLPSVWQVDPARRLARLRELGLDPVAYAPGLLQRRWAEVAVAAGLVALDATPMLAAEPDHAGLFLADGVHLSARGNEVVGRWLAAELAAGLR